MSGSGSPSRVHARGLSRLLGFALLAAALAACSGHPASAGRGAPVAAPVLEPQVDRVAMLKEEFDRTWLLLDEASRDPAKATVVAELRPELRQRVARLEESAAELPGVGEMGLARDHYLTALGHLRKAVDAMPGGRLGYVAQLRTALDAAATEWRAAEVALKG